MANSVDPKQSDLTQNCMSESLESLCMVSIHVFNLELSPGAWYHIVQNPNVLDAL